MAKSSSKAAAAPAAPAEPREPVVITKAEIVDLGAALATARDFAKTPHIAYKVIQFRKKVLGVEADLKELMKTPDRVTEFEGKRIDLCKEMAKKDDTGAPISKDNNFVMADLPAFDKALAELKVPYQEEIDAWNAKIKEINKMLEDPVSEEDLPQTAIPTLKLSWFKPGMPMNALEPLFALLVDDTESDASDT